MSNKIMSFIIITVAYIIQYYAKRLSKPFFYL